MNNKLLLGGAVILAVLVGGFFALNSYIYNEKQGGQAPVLSHKDATYVIDGKVVKLVNGEASTEAAPGSASKIITRYFGNEVRHDLDGDGQEDVAFLITQETGGSGTFYYAVAALNKPEGYVGSQALFLGDRIAPQSTNMGENNIVVVNYAVRKPGESMAVSPSVGESIWLKLDPENMQFGEVVQNFEGEADPSRMALQMKKWLWESALINDGREINPKKPGAFTLSFGTDGRFAATTDCNHFSGGYSANQDGQIAFTNIAMTKMYCEGSQDVEFARMVGDSTQYHFTANGKLILGIKFDSGTLSFR